MDLAGIAALLAVPAGISAVVIPLVLEQTHHRRISKMVDLRAKMLEPSAARDDVDWLIADSASELALRRKAPRPGSLPIAWSILGIVYGLAFVATSVIPKLRRKPFPEVDLSTFWGAQNLILLAGGILLVSSVMWFQHVMRRRRVWIKKQKERRGSEGGIK